MNPPALRKKHLYWIQYPINNPVQIFIDDTITAIATPPGEGGIGIIRIDGDKSLFIAQQLLSPFPSDLIPNMMKRASCIDPDTQKILDQVLFVYFKSPKSYSGNDIVEIHAHGGQQVLEAMLRACLSLGARMAEPGEFTKRAFLNGKMDLTQAEAVIDLIHAKSEKAQQLASQQLQGSLSATIHSIYDNLLYVLSFLEATFDFVDDDIPEIPLDELIPKIKSAEDLITKLLANSKEGILIQQGAKVALLGLPNAGKSSLFNSLLQTDRAIVTPLAGTTRDALQEWCRIDGIPINLLDTAGITDSEDLVEQLGIEKSLEAIKTADLVLLLLDATTNSPKEDLEALKKKLQNAWKILLTKPLILVENKVDQLSDHQQLVFNEKVFLAVRELHLKPDVMPWISAKNGQGIDALKSQIKSALLDSSTSTEDLLVTNLRHQDILQKTLPFITEAKTALATPNTDLSLIAITLRAGLENLGELTGKVVTEEILSSIFGRFCIGK